MAENGAHFSGEGHLIEGQIEDDVNKTIRPIACDADGHLIIDLDASTITIGTVDQGASGTDPWSIKIDQTGTNNNVDATITNFPSNQNVTVTNGAGGAAVNIQDGGNSITVDGTVTATPSGTQDVNIISTIALPVTDNGGSLTVDGTVAVSNFPASQPVSGTVTTLQGTSPWVVSGSVTTSPNVNVHDGTGTSISSTGSSLNTNITNTVPVTLTSTAITGNVTVVQPTGTNLHAVVDSGSITITGTPNVNVTNGAGASAVNIQDGGNSVTVDGTVTSNIGTTNGLALNSTLTDTSQRTQLIPSRAACYSGTPGAVTVAVAATDVFNISGSATKTVRVTRIEISTIATVTAISNWLIIKRSTLNTGGTSTTITGASWDSANAGSSITITSYTANPAALGTSVGVLRRARIEAPATTAATNPAYVFDFMNSGVSSGVLLRGVNENLAVSFNGAAVPAGLNAEIAVDWIEE